MGLHKPLSAVYLTGRVARFGLLGMFRLPFQAKRGLPKQTARQPSRTVMPLNLAYGTVSGEVLDSGLGLASDSGFELCSHPGRLDRISSVSSP